MTIQFLDLRPVAGTFQAAPLLLTTFGRRASSVVFDGRTKARPRLLASWRRGDDGRLECRWYLAPD